MTEKASEFYSKGAEKFAENYSQESIDLGYLRQLNNFADRVEASHRNGLKILDAGCGPGRDSQILSDKGFELNGVDLSKSMIDIAEKKDGNFQLMDICDLSFEDAYRTGLSLKENRDISSNLFKLFTS